jgi:hypothetical protein
MAIYNVQVKLDMVMVVEAGDEDQAKYLARQDWAQAVRDADVRPTVQVTGDVTKLNHLRDGWCGECIPYGGDGNTRLKELLTPNV